RQGKFFPDLKTIPFTLAFALAIFGKMNGIGLKEQSSLWRKAFRRQNIFLALKNNQWHIFCFICLEQKSPYH
ncbi:MAG: hypothetical protein ACLFTV_17135, partial [Desulfococcaceae bacterium]